MRERRTHAPPHCKVAHCKVAHCKVAQWRFAAWMCVFVAVSCAADGAALGSLGGFDVRLDTSIELSTELRVLPELRSLTANINSDDGDRAFGQGPVSGRLDGSAELSLVRGELGFDASADGWYDEAYHFTDADRSAATYNPVSVADDVFPAATRRVMGGTVELGSLYARDRITLDGLPVTLRLGRQTLIWGESLFFAQDGISAGQAAVDVIKAASNPLAEARELYLPVTQASMRIALPWHLSLNAYNQFEWRPDRLPGVASYFSTTDILDDGGERFLDADGSALLRVKDRSPASFSLAPRRFGVALRRDTSGLSLGLYALRADATLPEPEAGAAAGTYRLAYPGGISTLGVSASTYLGDDAIAGELSVRQHESLASRFQPLSPAGAAGSGGAGSNAAGLAGVYSTGRTMQALLSVEQVAPPGRWWDGANLQVELAATDLLAVETGSANRLPGTTRFALAVQAVATPAYYHLARELVLRVPVGFELGLAGRSSVDPGRDAGTGNVTAGVAATYANVWQVGVSFTGYLGPARLQPLADRDYVRISIARTF